MHIVAIVIVLLIVLWMIPQLRYKTQAGVSWFINSIISLPYMMYRNNDTSMRVEAPWNTGHTECFSFWGRSRSRKDNKTTNGNKLPSTQKPKVNNSQLATHIQQLIFNLSELTNKQMLLDINDAKVFETRFINELKRLNFNGNVCNKEKRDKQIVMMLGRLLCDLGNQEACKFNEMYNSSKTQNNLSAGQAMSTYYYIIKSANKNNSKSEALNIYHSALSMLLIIGDDLAKIVCSKDTINLASSAQLAAKIRQARLTGFSKNTSKIVGRELASAVSDVVPSGGWKAVPLVPILPLDKLFLTTPPQQPPQQKNSSLKQTPQQAPPQQKNSPPKQAPQRVPQQKKVPPKQTPPQQHNSSHKKKSPISMPKLSKIGKKKKEHFINMMML